MDEWRDEEKKFNGHVGIYCGPWRKFMPSTTVDAFTIFSLGGLQFHREPQYRGGLTVLMCCSSSVDMACAYSVFSLAMRVRLLISGLLFIRRSCSASLKSAATSAAGKDIMGNLEGVRSVKRMGDVLG
jgi:hypothetical protein